MNHELRPPWLGRVLAVTIVLPIIIWCMTEIFRGRWLIDPIAFSVGPIEVRWYGLFIALGIIVALEWTARRAVARGLDRALVETASWWAVIGGIIGARLGYVLQNVDYFSSHLDRIVAFTDGGLSIHGAILGGAIGLFVALGFNRKQLASIADAAIPGLLLAMILGRLGNFTNHELFGPPTDLPWKMFVPVADRPIGLEDSAFYHPTFLYDMLLNGVVLLVLLRLESRMDKPGQLTLWFFLGIAITRFIVEFWRLGDSVVMDLSLAQLVSIAIAFVTLTMAFAHHQAGRQATVSPSGRR